MFIKQYKQVRAVEIILEVQQLLKCSEINAEAITKC